MADIKGDLKTAFHEIPTWAWWIVLAGVGVIFLLKARSSSSSTAAVPTTAAVDSSTAATAGGLVGGGAGGGTTFNNPPAVATPDPTLQNEITALQGQLTTEQAAYNQAINATNKGQATLDSQIVALRAQLAAALAHMGSQQASGALAGVPQPPGGYNLQIPTTLEPYNTALGVYHQGGPAAGGIAHPDVGHPNTWVDRSTWVNTGGQAMSPTAVMAGHPEYVRVKS